MRALLLLLIAGAICLAAAPSALAGDPAAISKPGGFIGAPHRGSPATVAKDWLSANRSRFDLDSDDIAALKLSSSSKIHGGGTHFEFTQQSRGITAIGTAITVNVDGDGRVINAGGDPTPDLSITSATPTVTAAQARFNAQASLGAEHGLPARWESAKLVVFNESGTGRLAWQLVVPGKQPRIYAVVVDAKTGAVLKKISLTRFISGSVFDNYPGAAAGGTQLPVPLDGWLDNPSTTTQLFGPNAHVYADRNDDDAASPSEEVAPGPYTQTAVAPSAVNSQFCPNGFTNPSPCTWSGDPAAGTDTRVTNRNERGVQLFYFVNKYHDWLQQPDINFNGFQGTDRVIAQIDDGDGADCSHLNNANMATLPDGQSPVMQMYFFGTRPCPKGTEQEPAVSSADDASVVMHEYTHGLSGRLIGNGDINSLRSVQSGAMGEAWSDFYAMDYLVSNGYETDTPASGEVAVGKYVTNEHAFGIRYEAIDCAVASSGPACAGTAGAPGGGFTFADLGHVDSSSTEVHSNGEIWAQTLWDLRTALGPSLARRRITDGMRLSPNTNPSFLDERNAIVSADILAGGANVNTIWAVFAARGMGCSARTPSANSTTGVTAAFDTGRDGHCGVAPTPKPSFANANKTTRLDKKGRFKFHFTGSPTGARGIVTVKTKSKFKSGKKKKKKILSLGTHSFQVPSNLAVDLQLKVSKSTLKAVKRKKKIPAKVTIAFIGVTYSTTLTLTR